MKPSPPPSIPAPDGRLPALDGVRGLAVLMVLVFHFSSWTGTALRSLGPLRYLMQLGWCGVDLFFVLSGFLITGILWDARGAPHALRNFYVRRVLRIFPLYYAALAAVFLVAAPLWRANDKLQEAAGLQIWLWTYLTNVGITLRGIEGFHGLGHFWSLAVEEHFYLFWPLLVLRLPRQKLLRVCAAVALGAPVLRAALVLLRAPHEAVYMLTPSRMDSLALGGLLALAARAPGGLQALLPKARLALPLCGALAAAMLLPGWQWGRLEALYEGALYSLLALSFGGLVVLAAAGGSVARALSAPALRALGKYSYCLYVAHHLMRPLFERAFGVERLSAALPQPAAVLAFVLLAGACSYAVAFASWHLFEKRFVQLKSRFEYAAPAEEGAASARPA
jgi:peptidoglycan/LPS O-acetylase OafA/YrhL